MAPHRRCFLLASLAHAGVWLLPAAAFVADPIGEPLPPGARARLGTTRYRVPWTPGATALSPDGAVLVASAWKGFELCALDAIRGRALRWTAWEDDARTLTFLSDHRTVIVNGDLGVYLWDTAADRPPRKILPSQTGFEKLAISPDGRWLLRGRDRGGMQLVNVASGQVEHTWTHPGAPFGGMAWAPDGQAAVSWGGGELGRPTTLVFWDPATGAEIRRLQLSAPGGLLDFSPDGRTLLFNEGGQLTLREATAGTVLHQFAARRHTGLGRFAPDGRTLASGSAATTVLLWDLGADLAAARRQHPRLTRGEAEAQWDLLAADAAVAYPAQLRFAAAPANALGFLRARLPPAGPPSSAATLARWVADLGAEAFAVREEATRARDEAGAAAEPALRQELAGQPREEVRRRLEALLERASQDPPAAARRGLRAVEAMEWAGTAEAGAWLAALAQGEPAAALTRAAREAGRRLGR